MIFVKFGYCRLQGIRGVWINMQIMSVKKVMRSDLLKSQFDSLGGGIYRKLRNLPKESKETIHHSLPASDTFIQTTLKRFNIKINPISKKPDD
jgi:hypothetical protein